jgi:putative SOS response-associated peptidase YedK
MVAPIHPKSMPVILTTPEEIDLWLEGETPAALKLQRPLPDALLRIVARGREGRPATAFHHDWLMTAKIFLGQLWL